MKRVVKKYIVPHKENNFRPHLLRATGISLTLVLIIGVFLTSNVHRLLLKSSDFIAAVLPAVLVDLANADRNNRQIAMLTRNPVLEEAARLKAEDMAAKSYFAHNSPEGKSPWYWFGQAGYKFIYAGENLAVHFDDSDAVNTAWMNSPGHRENILNGRFTEIGIATARSVYEGRETVFVVELFGRPAPGVVAIPNTVAVELPVSTNPINEPSLAIINSSTVLGESGTQTFIAIENAEEIELAILSAEEEVAPLSVPQYASAWNSLVSSPTKTLAKIYSLISLILIVLLISVLVVRHDRRARHIVIVLLLLALLPLLYYAYRAFLVSEVVVIASKFVESFS